MSRWRKHVRNRRDDALSRVDWREFERLLADHYRRQGFRVEHCGTGASASRFDGGIDLKLYRADAYLVVQCKHWNVRQVTHNAMHELAGIMLTERATGAILITSGEFTPHARASAAKLGNMELVDGDVLRKMLGVVPEPAGSSTVIDDRAAQILSAVGERVMDSAERRLRRGARRAGNVAVANLVWLPLAKLGMLILVTLAFIWFINRVADDMKASLAKIGPQAAVPVTAEAGQGSPLPIPEVVRSEPVLPARATARSVEPYPRVPQTEAEIREQQRLADEAMRVLAPNTAEMDMGHLDAPDPDRYRAPAQAPDSAGNWRN